MFFLGQTPFLNKPPQTFQGACTQGGVITAVAPSVFIGGESAYAISLTLGEGLG